MMAVKQEEEFNAASTSLAEQFCAGFFDFDGGSSFTELLGTGDVQNSLYQYPLMLEDSTGLTAMQGSLETVNFPPNSSSISPSSTGDITDDRETKLIAESEESEKPKSKVGNGKKGQKRTREPRFAFVTKSEVDHLEDGYKWRKYGQKAVKNSHFPRGYYRCTSAACSVKKQVERSLADPAAVVTIYQGQHTHPSPVGPRGGGYQASITTSSSAAALTQMPAMNHYSTYLSSGYSEAPMNLYPSNGLWQDVMLPIRQEFV